MTTTKKSFCFGFVLFGAGLVSAERSDAAEPAASRDVGPLYQQLCANCHGEKLTGGKAGSLTDNVWRFGSDDATIARNILRGIPGSGMPGFAAALSEGEAQALVVFIHETAVRKHDPQPKEEQPLPVGVQHSEQHSFRVEPFVEGLDVPWSLTFLPDGRILVTERTGRLRVIENGVLQPKPIGGVPAVAAKDEGGLMSVVADPSFAQNRLLYLSFSDAGENDTAMTKIIRGRLSDGQLVDQETIFSIPRERYQKGYVLFGGRLAFQGDYLFFSVGERGLEEGTTGQAQDLTVPNGKIHRVFHDGKIPPDNPFVQTAGAFPSIWAYGVRNPQGLTLDPRNGELWESEHGPRGGDELNHIQRGRNYGWPLITYGMNYDGTPISAKTEQAGLEQPSVNWTPSIAVSEIEFYTGDRFPKWKNNLFVGSLAQQKFLRLEIERDRVVHREEVFHGLGRVRDIKTGPDGLLYVALELIGKPGRIVRLVPAEDSPKAGEGVPAVATNQRGMTSQL